MPLLSPSLQRTSQPSSGLGEEGDFWDDGEDISMVTRPVDQSRSQVSAFSNSRPSGVVRWTSRAGRKKDDAIGFNGNVTVYAYHRPIA